MFDGLTGEPGDDSVNASVFEEGTAGDDVLRGTEFSDVLGDSLGGNDEIYGDGAADHLYAYRSYNVFGSVLIDAGAGADSITFGSDFFNVRARILGGDGDDSIDSSGGTEVSIDAGAGADWIEIDHEGTAYTIALGIGSDIVVFSGVHWVWDIGPPILFTDFEAGDLGDRLVLDLHLAKLIKWDFYRNPFETGHLQLVQRGLDAVLQVDRDGDGDEFVDFATFTGIDASMLTAFNLGFKSDGSLTPGYAISGTATYDHLYGGGGNDTIDAGDMLDTVEGGAGDDVIYGGAGGDILDGQFGDDVVHGGADGDFLGDSLGGNDHLIGGAGRDELYVSRLTEAPASTVILDGGDDVDTFYFFSSAARRSDHLTVIGGGGDDRINVDGALTAVIDAGEGDDELTLTLISTAYTITLGAGADLVGVGNYGFAKDWPGTILFTDFEAGSLGDRLVMSASLLNSKLAGWSVGMDPFATGYLRLAQRGADTVLQMDRDGGGDTFETLFTFANVAAGSLTAFNLGGYAPGRFAWLGTEAADRFYGTVQADSFDGLGGDDIYRVDHVLDQVTEAAGGGNDSISASLSYVLAAGVHVETIGTTNGGGTAAINLAGNELGQSIYGNAGNNVLSGGGGADQLVGLQGNDVLIGGAGVDVVRGGAGNDVYRVEDALDLVYEAQGEGADTVSATVSYVLTAGAHVETLGTTDGSGTSAINLTGNELAQSIYGNAGGNTLRGGGGNDYLVGLGGNDAIVGGDGRDTLRGGLGDDVYRIDDAFDTIFEGSGEGADTVYASLGFVLAAGVHVEQIATDNGAATTAINLTGNELDQGILGNSGDNVLNGGGGADQLVGLRGNDVLIGGGGADDLRGGLGNDSYRVDGADTVIEAAGEGADSVSATASFVLAAGSHVETLGTADAAGTASIALTGNELRQSIYGNAGANTLNGGLGADMLRGLQGADIFAFTTALGGDNVDTIGDFQVTVDQIDLDDAVFAGLAAGALAPGAYRIGSAAADADDRILFNSGTGALLFDADGNGGGAAIQFATLQTGLTTLSAADFVVI